MCACNTEKRHCRKDRVACCSKQCACCAHRHYREAFPPAENIRHSTTCFGGEKKKGKRVSVLQSSESMHVSLSVCASASVSATVHLCVTASVHVFASPNAHVSQCASAHMLRALTMAFRATVTYGSRTLCRSAPCMRRCFCAAEVLSSQALQNTLGDIVQCGASGRATNADNNTSQQQRRCAGRRDSQFPV